MCGKSSADGSAVRRVEAKAPAKPQQTPSFHRQVYASILGWSSTFMIGTNVGFVSVGLYSLQEEGRKGNAPFLLSDWDISLFGSAMSFTAIIGSLSSGWIAQKYGRKWPSILSLVPYSAGWFVVAYASDFTMFLAGAIVAWLFVFLRVTPSRMHTSEIAHPRYRGQLLSMIFTFVIAGNCVEFIGASFMNWQQLAFLNGGISLALLFIEAGIPESHVWLISVGRRDQAMVSLQWVYGEHYDCEEAFRDSERHFEETREAAKTLKDIFTFRYMKPVLTMFSLILVRSFTGCTTVKFFVSQILKKSNSGIDPKYAVIILGCGELVFILLSGKMMDVIGRRKSVLLSGLIMGFSQAAFGVYLYFQESPSLAYLADRYNWMPLVFLTATMMGFCLGVGPVLIVLLGEILPIQIKDACNGLLNAWINGAALLTVASFQWMYTEMKPSGTFWFYSCCCFVLIALFLAAVPETKGQTLSDIERKVTKREH